MASNTGSDGDTQDGHPGTRPGLFSALRNIAATLLVSGRTRLELLANEVEEEKQRAVRLLLIAQAMVFCLALGVILLVALLALIFWDNRVAVVAAFTALFFLSGALLYQSFKKALQRPDRIFAASIAELEEDLRQLKAAARQETPGP